MKNDKHTTAIPEVAITQVHGQIAATIQTLQPYTIALTPHERQTMLKMGDKSLAFVEKAHDYAHDNTPLVPSYLDMATFDVDFQDAHGLWSILTLIKQLEEAVEDTIMAAGNETYHAVLAFYHNVQAAAKDDVPGAKAIFEDLKTRFPGGKRQGGTTETETVTGDYQEAGQNRLEVQNVQKEALKVNRDVFKAEKDLFNVLYDLPNIGGDVLRV